MSNTLELLSIILAMIRGIQNLGVVGMGPQDVMADLCMNNLKLLGGDQESSINVERIRAETYTSV